MRIAAIVVALTGLSVMLAWVYDLPTFVGVGTMEPSMKFSTSVAFLATGIAIYFMIEYLTSGRKKLASAGQLLLPPAILTIILLMSVHIVSAIVGTSSGIDNVFVNDDLDGPYSTIPGRPSVGTIVNFLLISAGAMLALKKSLPIDKGFKGIGILIIGIGGLAAIGNLLEIPPLFYSFNNISNGMSLHAGLLFIVVGLLFQAMPRLQKMALAMRLPEKDGRLNGTIPGLSIRTKFTAILLTVTIIPIIFIAGITLSNTVSLRTDLLAGSIIVLGLASAISVTFFALSLSDSLLVPLLSLKRSIHAFANGQNEVGVRIESTDEIGSLARDFDHMKKVILETNANLERLVKERTAELEQSKKQLEILVQQLREQERVMQNFINIAAHELKNPIAPILMASQIFAKREVDNRIVLTRDELELIHQNAVRLKRLCEDILDVAKIENNGIKLSMSEFSLDQMIEQTIEELKPTVRSGVSVVLLGQGQIVTADRDKLQQVLQNLLQNAIKFTMQGQIEVSMRATSSEEVVISVKDSGDGIHPQILPKLFSKFATKSEKGTGLGLYICKNIVEAHAGKIWAENNPTGGATFAFSLPMNKHCSYETAEAS